jgi:hypothetical protein
MKVSKEMHVRIKKGKNFKDVIAEEKNKGRFFKLTMKRLTSLSSSLIYGVSFLFAFISLDILFYALFTPGVLVWAGLLVATALVSSLFASRLTNLLKKQQWKYSSYT